MVEVRDVAAGLWLWRQPHPDWQEGFDWEPEVSSFFVESQGEAVSWTRDGSGYVTVSEGNPTALHHATCEMP